MERGDAEAKLLVTRHLPGQLVLGSEHADALATYRRAGELLALLHAQTVVTDNDFERRENEKSLALPGGPRRIEPATVKRLRAVIGGWPTPAVPLVPTHGDWQPQNWLVHNDVVSVIDFGRAAMRPAMTDFARLSVQDFRRNPNVETAFIDGYGTDPREKDACEAQGHRMIAEALSMRG